MVDSIGTAIRGVNNTRHKNPLATATLAEALIFAFLRPWRKTPVYIAR
jgi:hypothetical protein